MLNRVSVNSGEDHRAVQVVRQTLEILGRKFDIVRFRQHPQGDRLDEDLVVSSPRDSRLHVSEQRLIPFSLGQHGIVAEKTRGLHRTTVQGACASGQNPSREHEQPHGP